MPTFYKIIQNSKSKCISYKAKFKTFSKYSVCSIYTWIISSVTAEVTAAWRLVFRGSTIINLCFFFLIIFFYIRSIIHNQTVNTAFKSSLAKPTSIIIPWAEKQTLPNPATGPPEIWPLIFLSLNVRRLFLLSRYLPLGIFKIICVLQSNKIDLIQPDKQPVTYQTQFGRRQRGIGISSFKWTAGRESSGRFVYNSLSRSCLSILKSLLSSFRNIQVTLK